MNKRIVYTRFDGGISICCPSDECIAWMGRGGYWDAFPIGYLDIQIERQIEAGHQPDAARRFARALAFGGHTTAEALEAIRDRDCAHRGTAIELWDVEDVPTDRWYRNAWKRSHNGGPIYVDLGGAKSIQFNHIRAAIAIENKRRENEIDLFDVPFTCDLAAIREHIRQASDEMELRRVWPSSLLNSQYPQ